MGSEFSEPASASSVNHHRTIVNGIFNFAVKRGRFDKNPVTAVRQRPEPPGRDRIVSPAEFRTLWDKAEGDREMRAFLALAGTTTMRKGEILSLRWERVHLEDAPYATLVRTKTGHQRHVPIPQSIVKTLKALPSHRTGEYLFPSRPTARCPEPQRPYRWDFGKQFRQLAKAAGIENVRIHDLRHAGATILMTLGVPDPIVRKVTGHRSRELERYQHLTPELRALTVNLIATELFRAKRARKRLAHLPAQCRKRARCEIGCAGKCLDREELMAGWTGLEPATSDVTGRRSNQLNYHPVAKSVDPVSSAFRSGALSGRPVQPIDRVCVRPDHRTRSPPHPVTTSHARSPDGHVTGPPDAGHPAI